MLDKQRLRRSLLQSRRQLSEGEWRDRSDRLCEQIRQCPRFQSAQTVLSYVSFRQEPDLLGLVTGERRWGFPRCQGESLLWHSWQVGDRWCSGAFGIREPDPNSPQISPETVDLMLVPALACDKRGYRLGYGGGFYDRLLSQPQWREIPTLGIVFEFAYLAELPIEPWDCPLTGVCTEARWVETSP
ncbi:MAG: 5-formyltetrahydrofolate cyclo-ligase YgfA [Phormidium sp. OSCR]|nr:MAG: 5-formyltetrahydrofolate cyclo-ligase YgfA [Phormidium sp. OSCR]